MSRQFQDEIRNVLVLGTCAVNIAEFVRLFKTYLKYESYEDAVKWQLDLFETETAGDFNIDRMEIGNEIMDFIYYPDLSVECVNARLIDILDRFLEEQETTAIIFLVKPTEQYELFQKYRNCLLSKLEQSDVNNILYIFILDNDSNKYQQFNIFRQEKSQFNFEENMFYNISSNNWIQCRNFCKSVYQHINGLQNINIESVIPKKSILKLADDLLEFLIHLYIASKNDNDNSIFNIRNYKNNVTACYSNNCSIWRRGNTLKIPNICHGPCMCTELHRDISKCTVFDTPDKMCSKCKCDINSHSRYFFQYQETYDSKKTLAIRNLVTFSVYKKQNQEEYGFENIFNRMLDLNDEKHQEIFNTFKKEFNEEVALAEDFNERYSIEKGILTGLRLLCESNGLIIQQFIDEVFPTDFQLRIVE